MTRYIIMAQGAQRRMPSLKHPKCLLQAGDETLLQRTIRLLEKELLGAAEPPIVVAGHDVSSRAAQYVPWFHSLLDPGWCILDGLEQTGLWWNGTGRTTILLGDVLYSKAAMEVIMADTRPLFFAGTLDLSPSGGELYAMSFTHEWIGPVLMAIKNAPCRKVQRTNPVPQPGHLRNLLWMIGKPVGPVIDWDMYLPIDDFTQDFDTEEDLRDLPSVIAKMEEIEG